MKVKELIDGFLYRMINKALRNQDIITLYYLRYFLKDLHLQLEKYHFEQSLKIFSVYRGVGLTNEDFQKLKQGGLISFSEFLSTNKNQQLAEIYILRETDEIQPILFEIL